MDSTLEHTSIIICGAGPTGAMLSAQLGQANIDSICLEKEDDITTDPRGIALDEDGIRALQSVGIYDKIHSEIGSCMGVFNFIGGTKQNLSAEPFLRYDYTTSEGGTGHVGFICHKQPILEKHLRLAAAGTKYSQLRTGCTVTSIVELEDCVEVSYQRHGGDTQRIRGKFLVGSDGKTGFTRKKYLEPRGVLMQQSSRY
jgi:2-polyprenyl-6-methoxyphenol hydroxylase-like FAD-dependent oxidoreductase